MSIEELGDVEEYSLTINGKLFNTNINIMNLIKNGKFLEMDKDNLKKLPKLPGNYWICTDEPIFHCFNLKKRPKKLEYNGRLFEVVYNGQADNIQNRIEKHLYREETKLGGMSGISIDITPFYKQGTKLSHNKLLYTTKKEGEKKKLPYYEKYKRPINYNDIKKLHSDDNSDDVKEYLKNMNEESTVYFKNGININEDKHKKYKWLVIFYDMNKKIYHPISDIIEKTWRSENGIPKLCSYTAGR